MVEKARHEHMFDKYKNRYFIMYLGNPNLGYQRHENITVVHN